MKINTLKYKYKVDYLLLPSALELLFFLLLLLFIENEARLPSSLNMHCQATATHSHFPRITSHHTTITMPFPPFEFNPFDLNVIASSSSSFSSLSLLFSSLSSFTYFIYNNKTSLGSHSHIITNFFLLFYAVVLGLVGSSSFLFHYQQLTRLLRCSS